MMTESVFDEAIRSYQSFRDASGRRSESYMVNIRRFQRFCQHEAKEDMVLTNDKINAWCSKRATESSRSCAARVFPIISFLKYLNTHYGMSFTLPSVPKSRRSTYIPHSFNRSELLRFFEACDNIKPRKGVASAIHRVTIPVFFRLMYSSGLRPGEAVSLERAGVDLSNGVVSVKSGKGYSQRFVILHDSMLGLMRIYDDYIDSMLPDRKFFFPASADGHHPSTWVTHHFSRIWKNVGHSNATAYDLRHNYAIENINSWIGVGFGISDKLMTLSRSMGHRDVRSTMGYYSLTPSIYDSMSEIDNKTYDLLIKDPEQ